MTLAEEMRVALENKKNISGTDTSVPVDCTEHQGDLGWYSEKRIETCAREVYALILKPANN